MSLIKHVHTLMIQEVSNGYILNLVDEDSNTVDIAIATNTDNRGYNSASLITAIDKLFEANRHKRIDLSSLAEETLE